jgi:hypothetical protein
VVSATIQVAAADVLVNPRSGTHHRSPRVPCHRLNLKNLATCKFGSTFSDEGGQARACSFRKWQSVSVARASARTDQIKILSENFTLCGFNSTLIFVIT